MGNRNQESAPDVTEDLFEPVIGEFSEEAYEGLSTVSSEKQRLAEKRRRAEQPHAAVAPQKREERT